MFASFFSFCSLNFVCRSFRSSQLAEHLDQMTKQSGEWQAMAAQLKTSNSNMSKKLRNVETKLAVLNETNQILMERETDLNLSVQLATQKYQVAQSRLEELQGEHSKTVARYQSTINESKKKQWCTMCQKEGGRYYCSSQCEDDFW